MLIRGKKAITAPILRISGEPVEYTKEITYLGLCVNNKLGWESQRIGFRVQLNMKKSTPTRKMKILTNKIPLHIQAEASAMRA